MSTVTKRLNKSRQQTQGDDHQNEPKVEPVRSRTKMRVVCPANESHQGAKIWRTAGRIRYCKCNTCGATWKQIDEAATEELPVASVDCQKCGKPAVEYNAKGTRDTIKSFKCNHCGHYWSSNRTIEP